MEENNVKKSNNILVIIIAIILALAVGSVTTWFIMSNNDNKTDDKKTTETKKQAKEDKQEEKNDKVTENESKKEENNEIEDDKNDEENKDTTEKEDYYIGTAKLKDANGNLISFVKFYSNKDHAITSFDLSQANGVYDFNQNINASAFAESLHKLGYVCDNSGSDYFCKLKDSNGTLLSNVQFSVDTYGNISNTDFTKANGIININDYKNDSDLLSVLGANGYTCDSAVNN